MAAFSIEDWKEWITDVEKERKAWLKDADESWREIKRSKRNKQLWSVNPNSPKKKAHYPFWWSTLKTRQPLLYSRQPIPIGKDTTGGDDPTGRTAAICLERLAAGILKTFKLSIAMEGARDDFLVTNLGQCRLFYDVEEKQEPVKIRVTEAKDELGKQVFLDGDGKVIKDPNTIQLDEEGPYLDSTRTIGVENERVFLEPVLYSDFYVDPDARRYDKVRRLGFAQNYSRSEYEELFGKDALKVIANPETKETGKQRKIIRVFECWDSFNRETVWFPEGGSDFIKPVNAEDGKDLYKLAELFPCVEPLISNTSTDLFYPLCEYKQIGDFVEELHTIATRMYACARAIRCRFLFDEHVTSLQSLINELGETDGIGVPNLSQILASGNGDLSKLIAWFPTDEAVKTLENLYKYFANRLDALYQLTGQSDILRGQADNQDTAKTYGEQQLKAKFGMSRLSPDQERMQEFARANIELCTEAALKLFNDESLKQYIVPQTMEQEHQDRYPAALELLKNDRKNRFRVELETDSTIALNEGYDKQMAADLVNAISGMLQTIADMAEKNPQLAALDMKLLLHLVRKFRQGKFFEDEIRQACEDCIQKLEAQAQQPPQPDANMVLAQAEMMKAQISAKKAGTDAMSADSDAKLALATQIDDVQLAMQELDLKRQQQQFAYANAQADYVLKVNQVQMQREALQAQLAATAQTEETKRIRIELDRQIAQADQSLAMMDQSLEGYKAQVEAQEKAANQARLQLEARLGMLDMQSKAYESTKPAAPPVIVVSNPPAATHEVTRSGVDPIGNPISETVRMPLN